MIKAWPDLLDANHKYQMESDLFVKDLALFNPGLFGMASSLESADVVVIPQFSNFSGYVGYNFDREKMDRILSHKKKVVLLNTGGENPQCWRTSHLAELIWGHPELLAVFFSTECYPWHRDHMPVGTNYVPFSYVGYSSFGLGLREVRPRQDLNGYLKRRFGTAVSMNTYPPTRDKLWQMLQNAPWPCFNHQTNPAYQPRSERITWETMVGALYDAKIGFAPDGATAKTERHLFVPNFTVMMKSQDIVEFEYPWLDGHNCLETVHDYYRPDITSENEASFCSNGHDIRVLNIDKTQAKIISWLQRPEELYQIYSHGWDHDRHYQLPEYMRNYCGRIIAESL